MEVILLGTGSPMPDAKRGGPATLVKAGSTQILVDAGRAVVMRLTGAGSLPIFLSGVLITHLHSDHLTDLNDVITTHYIMSQAETPLHIYGPPRTQEVVNGILASLAPDISYRLAHHPDTLWWQPQIIVTEVTPGMRFTLGEAEVLVGETNHAPVEPTVSYRIEHEGKSLVLGGDQHWTQSAKVPTHMCKPCCAQISSALSKTNASSIFWIITRRSNRQLKQQRAQELRS
jgi:ribonuclease Z